MQNSVPFDVVHARLEAAQTIQAELNEVKRHYDAAMQATVALSARIMRERGELDLPLSVGHAALADLAAASAGATDGLGHVLAAHKRLTQVAETIGLTVTAWGPIEDSGVIQRARPDLSVAA